MAAQKEMLFRVISLCLVGVGFMATVAGADKDGADQTVATIEDLIYDIKQVEDVNKINNDQQLDASMDAPKIKTTKKWDSKESNSKKKF